MFSHISMWRFVSRTKVCSTSCPDAESDVTSCPVRLIKLNELSFFQYSPQSSDGDIFESGHAANISVLSSSSKGIG